MIKASLEPNYKQSLAFDDVLKCHELTVMEQFSTRNDAYLMVSLRIKKLLRLAGM